MRRPGVAYPNPTVGAVLVADGEIVGEGVTEAYRGRHGEIVALAAAGERAHGATLYVTMEPCAHHGTHSAVRRRGPRGRESAASSRAAAIRTRRPPAAWSAPCGRGRRRARRPLRGTPSERGLAHVDVALGRPFVTYKAATTLDGRVTVPGPLGDGRSVAPARPRAARRRRRRRRRDGHRSGRCSTARRPRRPGRAPAAPACVRPRAAPDGSELELRSGAARGGARSTRRRRRAVAPARGRADARDRVSRGRPRRQAALFVAPTLSGAGPRFLGDLVRATAAAPPLDSTDR